MRDSQNYTHAAADGRCIHEIAPSQVRKYTEQWQAITAWLESRLSTPLTQRDWLRPEQPEIPEMTERPRLRLRPVLVFPAAAAAVGALAIAMWFLVATREQPVEASPEPVSPQVAFESTRVEPIERRAEEEPVPASSGEALQERWQLTGVVSANGARVLILNDRQNQETVRVDSDGELDGWAVKESGPNYAVLVQGSDQVRMVLNQGAAL